jgi:hypothetical protein
MANNPIGPLLAADEQFVHQIVDTPAVVGIAAGPWPELGLAEDPWA